MTSSTVLLLQLFKAYKHLTMCNYRGVGQQMHRKLSLHIVCTRDVQLLKMQNARNALGKTKENNK